MPGHKGQKFHGLEALDITEIKGADYLLKPRGSSHRAKPNGGSLWQQADFYSAEGSSLCIKAMLGIVCRSGQGKR